MAPSRSAKETWATNSVLGFELLDRLEPSLLRYSSDPAAQDAPSRHRLAVTIALIIVLEENFQSCRDLWVLMMEKARSYVVLRLQFDDKQKVFQFAELKFLIDDKDWVGTQKPPREVLDFAPLED